MSEEIGPNTKPGKKLRYMRLAVGLIVAGFIAWGAFSYLGHQTPGQLNSAQGSIVMSY